MDLPPAIDCVNVVFANSGQLGVYICICNITSYSVEFYTRALALVLTLLVCSFFVYLECNGSLNDFWHFFWY